MAKSQLLCSQEVEASRPAGAGVSLAPLPRGVGVNSAVLIPGGGVGDLGLNPDWSPMGHSLVLAF